MKVLEITVLAMEVLEITVDSDAEDGTESSVIANSMYLGHELRVVVRCGVLSCLLILHFFKIACQPPRAVACAACLGTAAKRNYQFKELSFHRLLVQHMFMCQWQCNQSRRRARRPSPSPSLTSVYKV